MEPAREGPGPWLGEFRGGEEQAGREAVVVAMEFPPRHGVALQSLVAGQAHRPEVDGRASIGRHCSAGVDPSQPFDSGPVETVGMSLVEEGLSASVAGLLFEVAEKTGAAAVPDEGAGNEGQLPAILQQPPAKIDIITGGFELGFESAHRLEGLAANNEVAPREVFGPQVVQQDVGGGAGRRSHHRLLPPVRFGREIGAARGTDFRVSEGTRDPEQPVPIRLAIVIGVGDQFTAGQVGAAVAGERKPGVLLVDITCLRKAGGDLGGGIGGPVVDDDDLEGGILDVPAGAEAIHEGVSAVVGADHDGNPGWLLEIECLAVIQEGGEGLVQAGEGRLFGSVPPLEAEGPVVHLAATIGPEIGPGEEGGARHPGLQAFLEVPREGFGLFLLTVAHRIESELGDKNRTVAGEVLEPGQVALQRLAVFEEDVEGREVGIAGLEVLGARVVGVGNEEVGVSFRPTGLDEIFQGFADLHRAHPAHQVGGNLVGNEEGAESGVGSVMNSRRRSSPSVRNLGS